MGNGMETMQISTVVIGWGITIAIVVIGSIVAFVRQNGKTEALNEHMGKEIERLMRVDSEIMDKIETTMNKINDAMQWGRSMVEERTAFNERSYVRKEVCNISHQQVLDQLSKISSANIDVRLAKIETSQQQILVAIEELKRQKNTTYNSDR